jgi:ATP-binding cassette subfamily C protein CydD
MSALTKAWIKAETTRGQRAARLPIGLGAAQIICGIGQAFCAAGLLAAVLRAAPRGPALAFYVIGFAGLATLRAGLLLQAERIGFERGAAARRRLRNGVLGALLALGPAGLRGRHSAELAGVAVDRVEAMEGLHARWIPATTLAAIGPGLVGLAALWADWRSGLILLAAGLLVPFAMAIAGIGAGVAAKRQFVAMSRLQVRFLDRIRGISTIVLAGRAADEERALAAAAKELRQRTMRVLRVAFLSSTALDLAAAAALILIAIRFASLLRGDLGLAPLRGDLALAPTALFLLLLVPEFFAPLRAFSAVYSDRLAVEAVAEDLAGLPEPPAEIAAAEIRSVAAQGLTLAFEDVSFAWGETPVLEHFSLRVGAGEVLLLTGASGAGKSTIIDLILGFIVPDSGKVTINGAELITLVPAARSKMIGWIGQKPMIFNGTIGENIRFARPEASDEDVAEAIRLARLTEVIAKLPAGLETRIGEAGYGLSGGQAQRVAIARAFLKDAPLLLLDEPTAHLDPVAERDILSSIKRLAIGRTVILASHSALATEFARETGARRLDLDALRHARLRGVA